MPTPDPGQLFLFDLPAEDTPVLSSEVRNNLNALAQSNYTSDGTSPANPRQGMRRINGTNPNNVTDEVWLLGSGGTGGKWKPVLQNVQLGIPAPSKSIVNVTVPADVWTIDHNLGSQVIVQAFNGSWFQFRVVPQAVPPGPGECSVQQATANRVVITFQVGSMPTGFVVIVG